MIKKIIYLLILMILLLFLKTNKKIEKFSNKDDLYIMTIASENYSDKLEKTLNSFKESNPEKIVNIYNINWEEKGIKNFKKKFPKYNFISYQDNYLKKVYKKNLKSGYVLKLKVKLIMDSYIQSKKNVLFFDADTKILNNINPIIKKMNNYDIMITSRFDKEEIKHKFATGIMFYNQNKKTTNFLKKYNDITQKNIISKKDEHKGTVDGWWHDQIAFYKTYLEFSHLNYYFFSNQEHNLTGRHNIKNKKNKNAIFESS